jgi:hypothetical protein
MLIKLRAPPIALRKCPEFRIVVIDQLVKCCWVLLPVAAVRNLGCMKRTGSWIWRLCNTFMEKRHKEKIEGSAPESHGVELWNASRIKHYPQFFLE